MKKKDIELTECIFHHLVIVHTFRCVSSFLFSIRLSLCYSFRFEHSLRTPYNCVCVKLIDSNEENPNESYSINSIGKCFMRLEMQMKRSFALNKTNSTQLSEIPVSVCKLVVQLFILCLGFHFPRILHGNISSSLAGYLVGWLVRWHRRRAYTLSKQ